MLRNLLCIVIYCINVWIRLLFESVFLLWENYIFRSICQVLLHFSAFSRLRGVCRGLEQPVTFQTANTHTHRRTHTTAPSHPFSFNMPCEGSAEGSLTPTSSSMSLFGCTWHGRYTLVCSHALSHNKTTQNCLNILPALCMRSHAFQMLALSLFALLSLLFVFTQSHANTLSGSICTDWIDGLRAFCWLRRCQLWWVIGKLCLAATLSALVIHFVNPNL